MPRPVLIWFRRDARLADNPALSEAVRRGCPVVPVTLWEAPAPAPRAPTIGRPFELPPLQQPSGAAVAPGSASGWWRWHSLKALDEELRRRGSRLIVRRPAPAEQAAGKARELARLVRQTGARTVVWAAGIEPGESGEDRQVEAALHAAGLEPVLLPSAGLLVPPGDLLNGQGAPFRVFTPFWRALLRQVEPGQPVPAPARMPAPEVWPTTLSLDELRDEAARPWADGFGAEWEPGEAGANARLARLLDGVLAGYADGRDRPDQPLTSRLSPHLHHGELSARQVWAAVTAHIAERGLSLEADPSSPADPLMRAASSFLRQLAWRDFAHHLLAAFPHTVVAPLRSEFERFPWRRDPDALAAWQLGQTGYPLVDAGMRQLWKTGWMHNRARLVVASFLVKDLLLPWQTGAAWFWDTLVDADLANNTLGWQWVAGSGADAAPYFRILNPALQGRRFDPEGAYVRRFVPELARLPGAWVHAPWQAPAAELERAGVRLGETYPFPIVDHSEARRRALAAFDIVKGSARS